MVVKRTDIRLSITTITCVSLVFAVYLQEQALSQERINQDEEPQTPTRGETEAFILGTIYPCDVFEGLYAQYNQRVWQWYTEKKNLTGKGFVQFVFESRVFCSSEENSCDEARQTALQFVNDEDLGAAIVGPWCAGEIAEVYKAAEILHFVVFANKLLPYSRYRFQSYYNWSSNFAYLINHVAQAGVKKVGLAYPNHEKAVERAKQLSTQNGSFAMGNASIIYDVTYSQYSEYTNLLIGNGRWAMYSLDKHEYVERYNATLWDSMLLSMKDAGVEHAVFLSYGERVSIMNRIADLGIDFQAISFDEVGYEMRHYLRYKAEFVTSSVEWVRDDESKEHIWYIHDNIYYDLWTPKTFQTMLIIMDAIIRANSTTREKLISELQTTNLDTFSSTVKYSSSNIMMNVSRICVQDQRDLENYVTATGFLTRKAVCPSHVATSSIAMPIPSWECRELLRYTNSRSSNAYWSICSDEQFRIWENCTQKYPFVNSSFSSAACMARRHETETKRNQNEEYNETTKTNEDDSTKENAWFGISPALGLVLVVIIVLVIPATAFSIYMFRYRSSTVDGVWIPLNEIDFELRANGDKISVGLARVSPVFKATYKNYQVVTKVVFPATKRKLSSHANPASTALEIEGVELVGKVKRIQSGSDFPGLNDLGQQRTSGNTSLMPPSSTSEGIPETYIAGRSRDPQSHHARCNWVIGKEFPAQSGSELPGLNDLGQQHTRGNASETPPSSTSEGIPETFIAGRSRDLDSPHSSRLSLTGKLSTLSIPQVSQSFKYFKSSQKSAKMYFESRMEQLVKWKHGNLLTVFGAYVDENNDWCMITEFMAGGSLNEFQHGSTAEQGIVNLVKILLNLADGLLHLHSQDPAVVHGGLSASHTYINHYFVAKIGNFCLYDPESASDSNAFWWAPELVTFNTDGSLVPLDRSLLVDPSVDVYSFGIVMWELFSRQVLYAEETLLKSVKEILQEVVHGLRPTIPTDIPEEIQQLMRDCWHKDPLMRPDMKAVRVRLGWIYHILKEESDLQERDAAQTFRENAQLLHQVLPPRVAEKLLKGQKVPPEEYDQVTIFFSDIVGFTDISAMLEPQDVMDMLDRLYTKFDQACTSFNLFKVETIGDAYMCVGGIPEKQWDQTARVCLFAMAAISAAKSVMVHEEKPELGFVNIRVGMHTGRVIASVVGELNPRYCLFGDTVNTASRMESNSEKGEINLSPESNECLHEQVPTVKTRSRGILNIKGKGPLECFFFEQSAKNNELCRMYLDTRGTVVMNEAESVFGRWFHFEANRLLNEKRRRLSER